MKGASNFARAVIMLLCTTVVAAPLPAKNPERFSALAFHVWTGDDDLRSDSMASVKLTFPDGHVKWCVLKAFDEDGWGNNTEHDGHQCITVPRTFHQLRTTRITLYFWTLNESLFETADNWNVNRVRIEAQDFDRHRSPCLIDTTGNPLARLKGWGAHFVLSETPSTC